MNKLKITLLPAIALLALAANAQELKDTRDGKTYKTVKIGEQVWMAENLNYNANGGECYGKVPANCGKYGRLYNWETAKAVCPEGWNLPTETGWRELEHFAGGNEVAGKKLKAKRGWGDSGNGTDNYGFSALPSSPGYGSGDVGYYGRWWSATEYNAKTAYGRSIDYNKDGVGEVTSNKDSLFNVRCMYIVPPTPAAPCPDLIDPRNGKSYKTVKQPKTGLCWMAEDLILDGSRFFPDRQIAINACPPGWRIPDEDHWVAWCPNNDPENCLLRHLEKLNLDNDEEFHAIYYHAYGSPGKPLVGGIIYSDYEPPWFDVTGYIGGQKNTALRCIKKEKESWHRM
jgi:uncharacterized protein (TIGR02145 family)